MKIPSKRSCSREDERAYKGRCQSLIIRQYNLGDRILRHDGPETGRTDTNNLLSIDAGRKSGQSGSERINENGLSERDEDGGAEILAKTDKSGTNGHLVFRHVGLNGRDGLLHSYATGKAVEELVAHPGGVGGGGRKGAHET